MTDAEIIQQLQEKAFMNENSESTAERALSLLRKAILPVSLGAYGIRKGAINGILSGALQAKGLLGSLKPGTELATILPLKKMTLDKALSFGSKTMQGLNPQRAALLRNEAIKSTLLGGAGGISLGMLGNKMLFDETASLKSPEFNKLSSSNQQNMWALVKLAMLGACALNGVHDEELLKQATVAYKVFNKSNAGN